MREGEQKDGVGVQHGKWGDCYHCWLFPARRG